MPNEVFGEVADEYDNKYQNGYGVQHPEGHVIRFNHHILQYELGMTNGNVLDYGCGNGTHSVFFKNQGFTPFGCDVSPTAIAQAKSALPEYQSNFHTVESVPKLSDIFPEKFDLILANQVLYYLDDDGLKNLIEQFHDILKPGGVIFATMMATTDYYHSLIRTEVGGLSEVFLPGRLDLTTHINFKTRDDVLDAFSNFQKLHMGNYSHMIREDEGVSDHWMYVGQKNR